MHYGAQPIHMHDSRGSSPPDAYLPRQNLISAIPFREWICPSVSRRFPSHGLTSSSSREAPRVPCLQQGRQLRRPRGGNKGLRGQDSISPAPALCEALGRSSRDPDPVRLPCRKVETETPLVLSDPSPIGRVEKKCPVGC